MMLMDDGWSIISSSVPLVALTELLIHSHARDQEWDGQSATSGSHRISRSCIPEILPDTIYIFATSTVVHCNNHHIRSLASCHDMMIISESKRRCF